MNLKKFDLERALAGDPVITRDGRKVTQIAHFPNCYNPIIYAVEGEMKIRTTRLDGTNNILDNIDLFMASVKKSGWVNIFRYNAGNKEYVGDICNTKEEAENSAKNTSSKYIDTIEINWEE